MKSNREIRRDAWKILCEHWLWRLIFVAASLAMMQLIVSSLLSMAFANLDIHTWYEFWLVKLQNLRSGLDFVPPNREAYVSMTKATLFQLFVSYIFEAIMMFGIAAVTLKAIRNETVKLFSSAFGGFARPLEVAWLLFVMNLRVTLWSFLFFFPGIVAIYRYRAAWYLKTEHPERSAGWCIAESGRLMKGHKWQAFVLDLSFLGWLLLLVVALAAANIVSNYVEVALGALLGSLVSLAVVMVMSFGGMTLACFYFVARAVFYRELDK